jgi:bifunctional DNA-binding transcriptional regulator/antitoxin component of YhaV-PrlF toxin-antitoxin module
MAKVTSKLQLTVPKAIAEQYKIRPGDELDWLPAGEAIRVVKRTGVPISHTPTTEERLRLFDEATTRQEKRNARFRKNHALRGEPSDRGWTRENLYDRGFSR